MNSFSLLPPTAAENAVFPNQIYSNCFSLLHQYRQLAHWKHRSPHMKKCSLVFQPGEERRRKNSLKSEDATLLEKYCNRVN